MEQYKMIDLMSFIGVLDMQDNPISFPEFYDEFTKFLDSNKWGFDGHFTPIEEDLQ